VSYLRKLPEEKESVIATRGEPSYLGFIARERRVTVLPLEPRDTELYVNLRKYFSADQIILTLVLREAQLVRDRHKYQARDSRMRRSKSLGCGIKSPGNWTMLSQLKTFST
jgi:hypothetical protein